MNDDEQNRLFRLASLAAGAEIDGLTKKALYNENLERMMFQTTALERQIANVSDYGILSKRAMGAMAITERALKASHYIHSLGGADYLFGIRSQHEAMLTRFSNALPASFISRHEQLFGPLAGLSAQIDDLVKSLRSPNPDHLIPKSPSIAAYFANVYAPSNPMSTVAMELEAQLASITKPWSIKGNIEASIASAMRLSQLATFSRELPAFSKERSALKSIEFGQFDRVRPLIETLDDEEECEEVYTEAGRTPALVAFPSESYDDMLSATGWVFEIKPPEFIRPDGTPLGGVDKLVDARLDA